MKIKKVYAHPITPELYPIYYERYAKAVTREVLDNEIQFTTLRVFTIDENNIIRDITHTMEVYIDRLKLGKVLWPIYTTIQAENFKEYVDMAVEKGLYVFDIWGFVPGSRPAKDRVWGEYSILEENLKYLKEKLGDRFLGFDNGEQDGRYVGKYSPQHLPLVCDRKAQYKNFQKHFQKLGNSLQNYMVTLASLTFLHYFAKEGNTIMLGAETAQALPNNNMWFSFIRGAAKQYGLLYFGNAAVWNRWGYKSYESEGKSLGYEWGPLCGTSLSLLRRLMYSQYMYNCDILGFDQSWVEGDDTEKRITRKSVRMETDLSTCVLTPVGQIQQHAIEFIKKHGRPGIMHTPLGIIVDFFSGWVPPRHLYSKDVYKVWGNLPYGASDYQLDLVFDMLYPGYVDAGFYHDERGFLCATPFGEIADVLFDDVPLEILRQYDTLLVTSGTGLTYEFYDKIKRYVETGGKVIFFGDTIQKYYHEIHKYDKSCDEFLGLKAIGETIEHRSAEVTLKGKSYINGYLKLTSCILNKNAKVMAALENGKPVIIENRIIQGKVTIILSDCGIVKKNTGFDKNNEPDMELSKPYELTEHLRDYLEAVFGELSIIKPDNPNLQYSLCVKNEQDYTLMVANNTFASQGFNLVSAISHICSAEELQIEDDVKDAIGYLPQGVNITNSVQMNKQYLIDFGDVRLFKLRLAEKHVKLKEQSILEKKPGGLFLAKPETIESLKDVVLLYPEFIQHFSGILVSAEYLDRTYVDFCRAEAGYLGRQKVDLLVDFTSMINLYPDLSLLKNLSYTYMETIHRVSGIIEKAALYNIKGLILTLHSNAECNMSTSEAVLQMTEVLKEIYNMASVHNIQVYLQNRVSFIPNDIIADIINREIPGIKFVYNFSFGLCADESKNIFTKYGKLAGYLLSSPYVDQFGQMYNSGLPLWDSKWAKEIRELFLSAKENRAEFIALSANYRNFDDIYADLKYLNSKVDESLC